MAVPGAELLFIGAAALQEMSAPPFRGPAPERLERADAQKKLKVK